MNESDAQLKARADKREHAALLCGIAVVIGLVVEVALAAVFRGHSTWAENWGPVIADTLVAAGVFGEILFGRLSKSAQDELLKRTELRAAEAELQTEKLRTQLAWRRLSREQAEKISAALSRGDLPKFCLRIIHTATDPEASAFADDIAKAFRAGGWRVQFVRVVSEQNFSGMMIPAYPPPDLEACSIVLGVIGNAGIRFVPGAPPPLAGMIMAAGDDVSGPKADIHIGPKPPPDFG